MAQCNQKTPIYVSSGCQVRSGKAKKGYTSTLITATTSAHLPNQSQLILWFGLSLTNPIEKDLGFTSVQAAIITYSTVF